MVGLTFNEFISELKHAPMNQNITPLEQNNFRHLEETITKGKFLTEQYDKMKHRVDC